MAEPSRKRLRSERNIRKAPVKKTPETLKFCFGKSEEMLERIPSGVCARAAPPCGTTARGRTSVWSLASGEDLPEILPRWLS